MVVVVLDLIHTLFKLKSGERLWPIVLGFQLAYLMSSLVALVGILFNARHLMKPFLITIVDSTIFDFIRFGLVLFKVVSANLIFELSLLIGKLSISITCLVLTVLLMKIYAKKEKEYRKRIPKKVHEYAVDRIEVTEEAVERSFVKT
ncbi:uncharacterized protein LOC126265697 [Aethina tumida]|uniref:uncharacterized protein LOC126265697 n=1 Tax=Aethina tumida TaxID=116153 RepID=UPI0021489110|nr:uncharacterized protein LOC126265697 [Aethina tumida]